MPGSLWPHGLWPARLLCPWDFPDKNTGVGCHFLLQGFSRPRDGTRVACTGRRIVYHSATRETQENWCVSCSVVFDSLRPHGLEPGPKLTSVYDQNPAPNSQVPTIDFPSGASFPSPLCSFLPISLAPCSSFCFPPLPTITCIWMCSSLPGPPEGYLLRDGKSDDNLVLQDVPAYHCRVGLEVPDGDVHWGRGAVWGWGGTWVWAPLLWGADPPSCKYERGTWGGYVVTRKKSRHPGWSQFLRGWRARPEKPQAPWIQGRGPCWPQLAPLQSS